MRVEPYAINSIIHVVKRGARGMNIVMDEADKWRFVKSLYLLNDVYNSRDWHRETVDLPLFVRPPEWPERETLTRVLAWVLMGNHFHLLLQEKTEGGSAKFMQRLCGSMSLCFNAKYDNNGSIFQGSYKAKTVDEDAHLRHLLFYIQVKNVLELYPGGLVTALSDFDKAWDWALDYRFSSLPVYAKDAKSLIIDDSDGLISHIYNQTLSKKDAYLLLQEYMDRKSDFHTGRLQELIQE